MRFVLFIHSAFNVVKMDQRKWIRFTCKKNLFNLYALSALILLDIHFEHDAYICSIGNLKMERH